LKHKIDQHYRVRLILDNLPITTYDLEQDPESVRPGFELGFSVDGKHYINNHLMFKILVHKTNGQYMRARQRLEEMEAATAVEVCETGFLGIERGPMGCCTLCHV
jgi:transmembrane 9 superfamily member 2/4